MLGASVSLGDQQQSFVDSYHNAQDKTFHYVMTRIANSPSSHAEVISSLYSLATIY